MNNVQCKSFPLTFQNFNHFSDLQQNKLEHYTLSSTTLRIHFTRVYELKYAYSQPEGGRGSLSSLLGKNIKFERGEGHIKDLWKNITWKRRKQ